MHVFYHYSIISYKVVGSLTIDYFAYRLSVLIRN